MSHIKTLKGGDFIKNLKGGNNFKNINGNMSQETMIKIKISNKDREFISNFRVSNHMCPPKSMKPKMGMCFYCEDCLRHAFGMIKEYKKYYKVGKNKYKKEDFKK